MNAWLTWEGSNLQIPNWKKPFEMSEEFIHISSEFEVGDFCSRELCIPDTHPSLKSLQFHNQAGILPEFPEAQIDGRAGHDCYCLLTSQKRTPQGDRRRSEKCHERTHAPQQDYYFTKATVAPQ
jgi:hypothetical protein